MAVYETAAKILLKARPTRLQLADRLRDPVPDGIELYLDVSDISSEGWEDRLVDTVHQFSVPTGFQWIVEGPLRSLDGSFFDISMNTPANREVMRRIASFGRRIGAEAAVIHAISPVVSADDFCDAKHDEVLEKSISILRYYTSLCREAGMVPTIENVPPVTRMREGRVMHSIVGMEPGDLIFLGKNADDVKVTLDVSHAQLYLNACHSTPGQVEAGLAPLVEYLSHRPRVDSLDEYISLVEDRVVEAHFSNARGLLEEGMAYEEGDLNLDHLAVRLGQTARFLVTETIEPDPERADLMREAQVRMARALAGRGSS